MKTGLDLNELKELLADTTIFSVLSGEELERCASRLELVHFMLGQPICRAGDAADAFFIVYSGRARVIAVNERGEEVTVGTLTRGHSFGEQGLLTDARRHYTVRAAGELSLLRLDRADFEDVLAHYPHLRGYFEYYISETSIRNFLKLCTVFAPLEVRFQIPQSDKRRLVPGSLVELSLVESGRTVAQARIRRIDPVVDAASNALGYLADVLGGARLVPGTAVNVRLPSASSGSDLWIPRAAFPTDAELRSGKAMLFVLDGQHCAERQVLIGAIEAHQVSISAGLNPGDRVILAPPVGLKSGDLIEVM